MAFFFTWTRWPYCLWRGVRSRVPSSFLFHTTTVELPKIEKMIGNTWSSVGPWCQGIEARGHQSSN
uniref:Uncharacterized protein n=1 Tax=Arundo donax TaxID=35708 RepID=A0A0A9FRS3_ARUDO